MRDDRLPAVQVANLHFDVGRGDLRKMVGKKPGDLFGILMRFKILWVMVMFMNQLKKILKNLLR